MAVKAINFKVKGMQRDLSASAFNPNFAYENMNMRLTPDKENTLLSLTNEKGTKETEVNLSGTPIGIALINNTAIIFSTNSITDYIHKVILDDSGNLIQHTLYEGSLGFSIEHPIETTVYYESEDVQKVYWVDGSNQLRFVNAALDEIPSDYKFNFVEEISINLKVNIERIDSSVGLFPSGVIQYFITYYNKQGQETGIVYQSPMLYLSHSDRGATGEETCSCSFKIDISNADTSWDYLRIYSIHRTSINSNPAAYIVTDIKLDSPQATFIDSGNNESIGDTDLLYKTRTPIIANTITQKYNTLFAGNVATPEYNIDNIFLNTEDNPDNEFADFTDGIRNGFGITEELRKLSYYAPEGVYPYESELNKSYWKIVHFKGGEIYRIGVQFQNKYGEWSNPIYIGDWTVKSYPKIVKEGNDYVKYVPFVKVSISNRGNLIDTLRENDIIAFRGLIAQPISGYKSIMCQGVICPTVYSINDRVNNNIWGYSSWFFRPFPLMRNGMPNYNPDSVITSPNWEHNGPLGGASGANGEIQMATGTEKSYYYQISDSNAIRVDYSYEDWIGDYNLWYIARVYDSDNNSLRTIASPSFTDAYSQVAEYLGYNTNPELDELNITSTLWQSGTSVTYNNTSLGTIKSYIAKNSNSNYFVDQNTITFNSPDINDNTITTLRNRDYKVRIVGMIPLTSNYTSYSIQSEGTLVNEGALGEVTYDFSKSNIYNKVTGLISAGLWNDSSSLLNDANVVTPVNFAIYPWHRSGALGDQSSKELSTDAIRYSQLSQKVIANLKYSYSSIYFNTAYELPISSSIELFDSNEVTIEKLEDSSGSYVYMGNVDTIINYPKDIDDTNPGYRIYYTDSPSKKVYEFNEDSNLYGIEPISIKYKSTPHAVFKLGSDDFNKDYILPRVAIEKSDAYTLSFNYSSSYQFSGIPLWRDFPYNYIIEGIKEVTLGSSPSFTADDVGKYFIVHAIPPEGVVGSYDYLALVTIDGEDISYDTIRVGVSDSFVDKDLTHYYEYSGTGTFLQVTLTPVRIPAPIIQDTIDISEMINENNIVLESLGIAKDESGSLSYGSSNVLYLAELYLDDNNLSTLIYGGTSQEELKALQWNINGEPTLLSTDSSTVVTTLYGDTFFSRWDCLKTYPFTTEDKNQIVEILSFMVESSINLDGRTDRNRGNSNNNSVLPTNFNLYNEVYNQEDNYFTYRIVENENDKLESAILWSIRKNSMDTIDSWTNLYLTNSMDVDSRYGAVTRLTTINNNLLFFQSKAIGQLMYNENAQISTTTGIPVELGNSGTVTGYKYISDSVGLPDKWAFCNANSSIYFIDPYSSGIYKLADSLSNLSDNLGYRTWINTHSNEITGWNPDDFTGYVLYYDKANSEVYIIGKNDCMVYSELLQQFTSFYSYEDTPYFFNLKNKGFFLRKDGKLWEQHEGDYNSFFGKLKPYWVEVVANSEPTRDKIFNNLEFRADVLVEGKANNTPPFDILNIRNEYQEGTADLSFNSYKSSNLKKKFRIWRALIPRDNSNHRDRIRNPWAYIKLSKGEKGNQDTNKVILHDMVVYYFG